MSCSVCLCGAAAKAVGKHKKDRPDQRMINMEMSVVLSEQAQRDTVLPTGKPHTVVLCRLIRKHCSLWEAGNRA